jgi:NAD-dependent deacetylase
VSQLDPLIEQASRHLQRAKYAVALTGAGISTPSGIPDFRSPDAGIWQRVDPRAVASIWAFIQDPKPFFDWIHPLAKIVVTAKPNPAHIALAQLEASGPLKCVITQNIDLLHSKAGSQTVYEVHGHLREATCMGCYQVVRSDTILPDFIRTGKPPLCPTCKHVLKPNVILYGETLPFPILEQAEQATRQCDLMIVAGSSLEVTPVNTLPLMARQNGARLIFINLTETHLDGIADVVIRADVADVLPRLAAPFHAQA